MDFLATYLEPITNWVYQHPDWALLLTFLVSFSESLAFIGSIVPGSVTMTAVGILAGSGVMRIDLTLLAAILGAIAGDSVSYSIGRLFSEQLTQRWPFSRYPTWLNVGKDYFNRHGGKSVLIGRFAGPLRSLIPIIAGMMGMNRLHFLGANVASAIGWSCLYVVPGILIGTASSELSAQSASKLFLVVLFLLALTWVLSVMIKWVYIRVNQWLRIKLNTGWTTLMSYKRLSQPLCFMTPLNETDHDATASHCLLLVICVSLIAVLLPVAQHSAWIATLNESIHQFCLSCRTQDFDAFFIIVRLDMSSLALVSFGLAIIVYATYHRDWRLLRFWVSLILTTALIASALSQILIHKTSAAVLSGSSLLTFPLNGLVFATALFSFLMYYMAKFYHQTISVILRALLLSALLISGIALIYLGEDAFMNVILAYLISFSNALTHWIFYRRRGKPHYRSYLPITLSILFLIIATGVSSALFFDKIAARQQPHTQQFVIHHHAWWNQQRPLLPLYSTNRFGKKNALMNIQFSGSIKTLQQSLEQAGWQRQRDSLFNSLMQRITHQKTFAPLPLMAQLYLNKKPELLMVNTLSPEKNGLIIRFWRSNFHLLNHSQVIWIGSIQRQNHHHQTDPLDPIDALSSTLTDYRLKKVQFNLKSQLAPDKGITPLLLIERIN